MRTKKNWYQLLTISGSPRAKKVELVADSKSLYVQLNESDSEELFKLLTDKIFRIMSS